MKTKYERDWICSCGELQSKHNQWFEGDICEQCFSKKLSEKEELQLANFLNNFKVEQGLHKISGGFVKVVSHNVSSSDIELELLYGSSDESGRYVTETVIFLDRETFKEI